MTFSLPTIKTLPIVAISSGIGGYLGGMIAGSSPSLWAKICCITACARNILFLLGNEFMSEVKNKHRLYFLCAVITNATQIVAFRQFDLIATKGTIILSSLSVLILFATATHLKLN